MFWDHRSVTHVPGHTDFMASHAHHFHGEGLGSKLGPTREAVPRTRFPGTNLLTGRQHVERGYVPEARRPSGA